MLTAIRDALILQKEELNNKSSQPYIKRFIKISGEDLENGRIRNVRDFLEEL